MTPPDEMRIDRLRAELRDAAHRFLDALDELEAPAAEMVSCEAQLRAALYAAGQTPLPGPDVRSLAAEAALAALGALRPHVPFVTAESGRRAAEELKER